MPGAVLLALSSGAVLASSALLAACLRQVRLVSYLLAVYLVARVEVGLSTVALTPFHGIGRPGLLVASAAWLALGDTVWVASGRPGPPEVREPARWFLGELRSITVGPLVATVCLTYTYLVTLAIATPQNEEDALTYHLSRAALWAQGGAIRTFGTVADPRIDGNPILAELGPAWLLALGGSERFVWVADMGAVVALALAAFALARRAGIEARPALIAGLLVPTLPVISLQAGSAMNDLVVASFVVTAAVFTTDGGTRALVPLALASGLAVATKFTAPFLLPLVGLSALVALPRRRWVPVLATMAIGALAGAGWYAANWRRTGTPDGGLADWAGQEPVRTIPSLTANVERLVLDAVEAPGMQGIGVWVYVGAGLLLVAIGLAGRGRRTSANGLIAAGMAVASLPILVFGGAELLGTGFGWLWTLRGEDGFAEEMRSWSILTLPDATRSWFGPLGVIATAIVCVTAFSAVRHGTARALALALASAPFLGIGILAVALSYDPWRGRLLVAPWVMGVAAWSLLARRRGAEIALTVAGGITVVLCGIGFHGKPLGLSSVTGRDAPSVWTLDRWEVQTLVRGDGRPVKLSDRSRASGEATVIRAVERRVPEGAPLAAMLGENDLVFPYVGRTLERPLTLLNDGDPVPARALWLVASPDLVPGGCVDSFAVAVSHPSGWRLLRRTASDRCDPAAGG